MTTATATQDLLDLLAEIAPDSPLAAARLTRGAATQAIQNSYLALFSVGGDSQFSLADRYEVARQVAGWHGDRLLAEHYSVQLEDLAPSFTGSRLPAALTHAKRLSRAPSSANAGHLQELQRGGWSLAGIVTLSQLIAYVSFQSRLLRGYRLIAGRPVDNEVEQPAAAGAWRILGRTESGRPAPAAFTLNELGWEPWVPAKPLAEFSAEQQVQLAENGHADSEYFRLLARNLPVLRQRTLADKGIFYTAGGLTRKERELAATVASKVNGCIYCASVHARKAAQLGKQPEEIQRLLARQPGEQLTTGQSERWQALIAFTASLSATPASASARQLTRLRELGLDDLQLLDLVQSAAFFAWANRLMLTLGEPFEE